MSADETARRREQLSATKAAQRRSAAKWFRKHPRPEFGPELLGALQRELSRKRAWEGQYHLARAVGATDCHDAIPVLESMLTDAELAPMPRTAAVHSLFLLQREDTQAVAALFDRCMASKTEGLYLGLSFAVGALALPLDAERRRRLLTHANQPGVFEQGWTRYLVCATRQWDEPEAHALRERALDHPLGYVRDTAAEPITARCRCDTYIL